VKVRLRRVLKEEIDDEGRGLSAWLRRIDGEETTQKSLAHLCVWNLFYAMTFPCDDYHRGLEDHSLSLDNGGKMPHVTLTPALR